MGRWSIWLGGLCFLSATGCTLPFSSNLGQPGHEQLANIKSQNLVPSVSSNKSADPDLAPDKAAKLCLATGEELEKNGHLDQAIHQYELALQHQANQPLVHKKLAGCLAQQQKYDLAIAQYQKGLALAPKDPDILNDLGFTYYEMEDFANAEKYLKQAIANRQNHQRAFGNLGLVLGRQQKWKESLEAFKKAGPPATAQANLAAMYLAAGQKDEARKCCNIALGLDPQLQSAKDLLAKLDALPKDEKAEKTIQQAEARITRKDAGSEAVASADLSNGVQLQKPVRVVRQPAAPLEFKPVK